MVSQSPPQRPFMRGQSRGEDRERLREVAAHDTHEDGSPLSSRYPHEHPGWGEALKDTRLSQEIEVPIDTIDRVVERTGVPKINTDANYLFIPSRLRPRA